MIIDFNELWKEFNINATGVIHAGAHRGQEAPAYYANGITHTIWIEAIPSIYNYLLTAIAPYPNAEAINALIGEKNYEEVYFKISNNDGQSSSILEFGTHKTAHPEVEFIRRVRMQTFRLDYILSKKDLTKYQFLNLDLQGYELAALRSLGDLISSFSYIYTEVNKAHLYKGCPLIEDIDKFLEPKGFTRVKTKWEGNFNWGDAFYIKNKA